MMFPRERALLITLSLKSRGMSPVADIERFFQLLVFATSLNCSSNSIAPRPGEAASCMGPLRNASVRP